MPYKLTYAENPENVSEREYVENVPSFRSTAINSCVCLISQTGDSVLTAVHMYFGLNYNVFTIYNSVIMRKVIVMRILKVRK